MATEILPYNRSKMGVYREEYERNINVAKSLKNKQWKGYALICNGEVIGI